MTLPKAQGSEGSPARAQAHPPAQADPAGVRLAARLGYAFRDPGLLCLALTHRSYANENPQDAPTHNERLEFLGDAVLDLIVSDLLYSRFPDLAEGELSKLRASLVAEPGLAELARELDLGPALRIGRGEAATGGRTKASLLADTLEAVVAAIYLDSSGERGLAAVRDVITRLIGSRIEQTLDVATALDFKTELQEWAQKRYKEPVHYRIVSEGGPDHEKVFEAAVLLREQELARGQGRTKKQAEQAAARTALAALRTAPNETAATDGARP